MKLALYCRCGALLEMEAPPSAADVVIEVWRRLHTGDGHADTDRSTAAREYERQLRGDADDPDRL